MATDLTEATYDGTIEGTEGVSIVQFTAPWCGPCRMIAPVLTELESEGKITYYKVNVDENSELARRFQIMSIPTLQYYKDGKVWDTTIGLLRKADIEANLERLA